MFVKDPNDPSYMANNNLYDIMKYRGSKIPSALQLTIDENVGMYNNKIDFCPRSQPMPISMNRINVPESDFRDVCFSIKVGPNQVQSAFTINPNKGGNTEENNEQRKKDLIELIEEIKEFNTGNCLTDINHLLFASYDQTIFTTAEFKYSMIDKQNISRKYYLKTPENVYFVREKLHGTVRDVIDGNFKFINEETKYFNDVIMFQMARSVNIMHNMHWTHRDIKPENFYVKKTVDHRIEVYLGEFYNSVMTQTVPATVHGMINPEDHVHGGPFYIPNDATTHVGHLSNDLYALGMTFMELLTHDDVEQVYKEKKLEVDHKQIDLSVFADEELFEQDFVSLELKKDAEKTLDPIQVSKPITQEAMFDFDAVIDNSFEVEEIDLGYLKLIAKNENDMRRDRILTNKNEVYGEMTEDLFGFVDSSNYGDLNFNPKSEKKTTELVKKADNEITEEMVFEDLNHEFSLPSVNHNTLSVQETLDVDNFMIADSRVNNLFIDEEKEFRPNEIQKPMVILDKNNNPHNFNAHKFLDELIRNMVSQTEETRFINAPQNQYAKKFCTEAHALYVKTGVPSDFSTVVKYGLSTLECVMVLIARAIEQRKENGMSGEYDFFAILDASKDLKSMSDVFNVIMTDRVMSYNKALTTFDQYIKDMYTRRKLLI